MGVASVQTLLSQQTSTSASSQTASLALQAASLTATINTVQSQNQVTLSSLTTTQGNLAALNGTVVNDVMSSITAQASTTKSVGTTASQQTSTSSSTLVASQNSVYATLTNTIGSVNNTLNGVQFGLTSTQLSLAALSSAVANNIAPAASTATYSVNAFNTSITPTVSNLQYQVSGPLPSRVSLLESFTLNPRLSTIESTVTSSLVPSVSTLTYNNLIPRMSSVESAISSTITPQISTLMSTTKFSQSVTSCILLDYAYSVLTAQCLVKANMNTNKWFGQNQVRLIFRSINNMVSSIS